MGKYHPFTDDSTITTTTTIASTTHFHFAGRHIWNEVKCRGPLLLIKKHSITNLHNKIGAYSRCWWIQLSRSLIRHFDIRAVSIMPDSKLIKHIPFIHSFFLTFSLYLFSVHCIKFEQVFIRVALSRSFKKHQQHTHLSIYLSYLPTHYLAN